MTEQAKTKVIINGAGPTGLTLACQLLRNNIDFVILDKNEKTTHLSKAMAVQARTLEIFDEIGLAEKAIRQGQVAVQFSMIARGKIRGQIKLGIFGQGMSPFPFALILEQNKTEKLLAEWLCEKGGSILWGNQLLHFEETNDAVLVHYKNKNGEEHTIEGEYLVGCDGAGSLVRHQLGFKFEGDTQERMFYVADVKIESPITDRKDAYFVMINKGFVLFFPLAEEKHYRVIGTVPDGVIEKENTQFSDIKQIIKNQLEIPVQFVEENWFSTYKVHSRMTDSFGKGRCFIAGDAAHIHTPAGGQGMNTGIQDAYNLAWKLAFVIHKKADKKLLETYNEERKENAKNLLKTTDRMFEVLAGTSILSNFFRMYIMPFILNRVTKYSFLSRRIFPLLSQIGIKYPNSSLTIKSSVGKTSAGDRMPYFQVNGESIFDKLKDPVYKMLYFVNKNNNRLQEVNHTNIELIKLSFEEIPSIFTGQSDFYIVVRPDNYISYTGKDLEKIRKSIDV